jgi:hypothetical protein
MTDPNPHADRHGGRRRAPGANAPSRGGARARKLVAALLGGACLAPIVPGAAHADPPLAPSCTAPRFAAVALDTKAVGAGGLAFMYRRAADGAVCGAATVTDTLADGRCAHVALRWKHVNGRYYVDGGLWICGVHNSARLAYGWRNPTKYRSVDMLVWRDGTQPRVTRLHTFR